MKIELTEEEVEKIQRALNIATSLTLMKEPRVHATILEGSTLFDAAVREASCEAPAD